MSCMRSVQFPGGFFRARLPRARVSKQLRYRLCPRQPHTACTCSPQDRCAIGCARAAAHGSNSRCIQEIRPWMRRLSPFFVWVDPRFYPIADERSRIERWISAKICTICWLFRFGFAPGAAFSVVHAVQHRILTHGVCRACMMAPVTTRAATLVLRQSRLVDPRLVALIRVIRLKEPALTAAN